MRFTPFRSALSTAYLQVMLTSCLTTTSIYAAEPKSNRDIQVRASPRPQGMPLTTLPQEGNRRLEGANPKVTQKLRELLVETTHKTGAIRDRAHELSLNAQASWLPSIAALIDEIAERRDRVKMGEVLEKAIDQARSILKQEGRGAEATPDYLDVLLQNPQVDHSSWRNLVELLSLSRMLVQLNSTPACRELVRIYQRFGEFMRLDTQRQLELLGDTSIAALIETQRNPTQKLQKWATKQLKIRQKLDPQQAVRTDDPHALGDILVALGMLRDAENTRLILSYASSNRTLIRNGARQGIVELGRQGHWQLKDAYLSITGKTPNREWTWQRTARELFTEYDRMRVQELYELYAEAQALNQDNQPFQAAQTYGRLLTLEPQFVENQKIAEPLLSIAEKIYHQARDEDAAKETESLKLAELSAQRVLRIAEAKPLQLKAQALLYAIEYDALLNSGIYDRTLQARVQTLNPQLKLSEPDSNYAEDSNQEYWSRLKRYGLALLVALLTFLGIFLILRSMRKTPT